MVNEAHALRRRSACAWSTKRMRLVNEARCVCERSACAPSSRSFGQRHGAAKLDRAFIHATSAHQAAPESPPRHVVRPVSRLALCGFWKIVATSVEGLHFSAGLHDLRSTIFAARPRAVAAFGAHALGLRQQQQPVLSAQATDLCVVCGSVHRHSLSCLPHRSLCRGLLIAAAAASC